MGNSRLKYQTLAVRNLRCGNFEDQREMIAMERLRDAVLAELAASNCSKPFDPKQVQSIVERQLHELRPRLKTTSHLPYTLMIERAILKLSEEGEPSEKDLADFILKEYEDLPLAHESFVSHHLRKLCERGGVVCTNDGRYAFRGNNTEDGGVITRQGKRKMCSGRGRRGEKRLRVEGIGGKENVAEEIRGGKQSAEHEIQEQVEELEFRIGGTVTELDTEEVFKANHLATEELNKEHSETVEGQAELVQELPPVSSEQNELEGQAELVQELPLVNSEQNELHDQGTFLEASMLSKPQNELQLLAQNESQEKQDRWRPPSKIMELYSNPEEILLAYFLRLKKLRQKHRGRPKPKTEQIIKHLGLGRPHKPRPDADSSIQVLPWDECVNREEQLPARGRGRPPKSKQVAMTNEDGTMPSNDNEHENEQTQPMNEYQNKKDQLPARGRSRPPKSKQVAMRTEDGMVEQKQQLLPSEEYQNKEEQLPVQRSGRPPKSRQAAMTTEDGTVPSNNKKEQKQRLVPSNKYQNKKEQLPARGRGRPPKSKKVCMTTEDGVVPSNPKLEKHHKKQLLPSQLPVRGRGRPPKSKQDEMTTNDAGRGSPPKSKQDEIITEDVMVPQIHEHEKEQEQPVKFYIRVKRTTSNSKPKRGRGRPPKSKPDTNTVTENHQVPTTEVLPEKLPVQERTPNAKSDEDAVTKNPLAQKLRPKPQHCERPPKLRPKPQLRERPPKLPRRKAGI